jgi:peptidoglycan hydrolase CwlO-like protein
VASIEFAIGIFVTVGCTIAVWHHISTSRQRLEKMDQHITLLTDQVKAAQSELQALGRSTTEAQSSIQDTIGLVVRIVDSRNPANASTIVPTERRHHDPSPKP